MSDSPDATNKTVSVIDSPTPTTNSTIETTNTTSSASESASAASSAKYTEEDDSPGAFSVIIGTSYDSTNDDPSGSISILIRDEEGRTTDRTLLRYSHSHLVPFNRGHSDLFVIANQPTLSNLTDAEIHYNPREPHESPWKLLNCYIYHHELGKLYTFQHHPAESKPNLMVLRTIEEPVQIIPSRLDNPFE